jgi:hypothetical protein
MIFERGHFSNKEKLARLIKRRNSGDKKLFFRKNQQSRPTLKLTITVSEQAKAQSVSDFS